MKEIRCSFAVMVLLVILGGLILSGMESTLIANTTSGLHTTIPSGTGSLIHSGNAPFKLFKICPEGGPDDC